MLNGHTGEDAVKKSDEAAADAAMNKINGRFAAHGIDDVGAYIDLIKGNARRGDGCGSTGFPPKNDETYKGARAVDQGRLKTGREEGVDSGRGNQIRDIEHVPQKHLN